MQSPIHHAEGDVWTHTKMVVTALLSLEEYQQLKPKEQYILFLSALLHDVAKPQCTVLIDGKIRSPKHAKVGEKVVRELLWDADMDIRENVCALVRLHGLPLWTLDKQNPNRQVIASSLRLCNHHLYLLCKSDILGRICQDEEALIYHLELFKEFCLEQNCFWESKSFHNNHSRFKFFYSNSQYTADIYDDTTFEVIVLSGIPGSGKDTYAATLDLPIVSLDQLRKDNKVKRGDRKGEGRVINEAYEMAREYCRKKQSFIWNSTNLSKDLRAKLINTLKVYQASFKIVYIETNLKNLYQRRKGEMKDAVITKMLRLLEIPTLEEAHEVIYLRN